MKTIELLSDVEFNEKQPHVQSLHSNREARALRFAFLPEQQIKRHDAPYSPVHVIVLQGKGVFAGEDGIEQVCGTGMMLIFNIGEPHTVRALDEDLVYVAIYNGVSTTYDSEHRKMVETEEVNHTHD